MSNAIFRSVCLISLISFYGALTEASDSEPVATVNWLQFQQAGRIITGEIVPGENGQPDRLKVTNTDTGTRSLPLCVIDAPPIKTPSYAVRGTIRYENVVGVGFLEMWNHFPKGAYFTRTMDSQGPMQMITGTSPERQFLLPFHTLGQTPPPMKLAVNLVLNGLGTVEIGPLELIPLAAISGGDADWWSGSTGGLVGGVGGTILGLLGGLLGALTSMGKAKRLVLVISGIVAGTGALLLLVGIYAIAVGQSYNVFYPLLMTGGLMLIGGGTAACIAPLRYRDLELRRMQALDVT